MDTLEKTMEFKMRELFDSKFVYQSKGHSLQEFSEIRDWAMKCVSNPLIGWSYVGRGTGRMFDMVYDIGFAKEADFLAFELKFK